MVVSFSGAASNGGSGSSSPHYLVQSDPEISSYVQRNVKRPNKKKPHPAVDAASMVESYGPETHPCDEQKLEGKTYAKKYLSADDVSQYKTSMPQLPHQPPYHFGFDQNVIFEQNRMIYNLQKQLKEQDEIISEKEKIISEKNKKMSVLRGRLENMKEEVCTKDNLLKEMKAELATCSRNLYHCDTARRELEEWHRASQERISWENRELTRKNKQLRMERARFDACNGQQSFTIHSLQSRLNGCEGQLRQLSRDYQRQVALLESFDRNAHEHQLEHQRELDFARRKIQALTDELRTLQNHSMGQNNGNQQQVNGDVAMDTNSGVLPNGNANNAASFVSSGNASTQAASDVSQKAPSQTDQDLTKSNAKDEHDKSVDGQALHSGNVDVHTSLETETESVISPSTEVEQAASEVSQFSTPSQIDQDLTKSDAKDGHDTSVDGQALHSGNLDVHINLKTEPDSVISPLAEVEQVLSRENDANTISIQWGSSPFTSKIPLGTLEAEQ